MKTIKVFFAVLAIMAVGTSSFNIDAMAAQVTRINENKGLIVIDGNKNDGFVMGAIECFYSTSGEEITCGSVQQTSDPLLRLEETTEKQNKFGMEWEQSSMLKTRKKWGIEQHDCVDDSDCGAEGYCVNGKCQGTKGW